MDGRLNDAIFWNNTYPVGQPIELREDDGSITYTQAISRAWTLADGTHVVSVEGKSGGYSLERIEPRA